MKALITLNVLALTAMAVSAQVSQRRAESPHKKTEISSAELAANYTVIGPLGKPLGEVMTVEGVGYHHDGKGYSNYFQVESVNGKKLARPVRMLYEGSYVKLKTALEHGKRYRFRAYQHGAFRGVSPSMMEEYGPVQSHGYTFMTDLVLLKSLDDEQKLQLQQQEVSPFFDPK